MKIKKLRCTAFFNLRALIVSLLCLTAVMVTLFAFGPVVQGPRNERETTGPSRWLTRLASSVGIGERSQPAGAIKVDKDPAEQPPGATQPPAGPYTGPVVDLRPVRAVRSGNLRDLPPIDPATVPKLSHPRPVRPKPPTQSGGPDGPLQTVAGDQASAPTPTGLSFDGVGVGLAGFSPSGNPPDVNGRVGSTQYVQWNNTSFAVFNKTTGALEYGPAAGNTLFQALGGLCASHNDGDPVVSYDILAGRWVLSQFLVGGPNGSASHQCFAVSATSDATGEYYLYDFLTDPVNFVDYPHQGVWPDGYYMAAHIFAGPGLAFITGRVYVFEREKMIDGLAARMQVVDLGQQFGHLPADLDSLTPPPVGEAAFVLGPNRLLTNLTNSYRVQVTWDPAPTIAVTAGEILGGIGNVACLSGATAEGRDCVPQPPPALPTDYLDSLDGRYMYRLAYRNQGTQAAADESLVVSATSTGSASVPAHGAVEWFEFRHNGNSLTQPTLFQSGTYDPDTSFRWMPSIAMDKDRNIALGYSKSSTTVIPGIYLTGRLAADPAGTMGAEIQMQAGIGVQLGAGNRWGDYTSMTLDPIDQCTFYYTNEYLKTNGGFNWSTRIAAFKFPACVSAAGLWGTVTGTITSSETGAPISGVTVTLSNGYAGASNATGIYTILVPAGSYTATAADADRNCTSATPASANVAPPGGGMVTQNFAMTGTSKLEGNGFAINDSLGNNNGIVNRAECVLVNLGVKNNGCATETAISATLTTTTPGVTVVDGNSGYPDMVIDAGGTNTTPFKISVSDTFVCGTEIALSLNLTYASGSKSIPFTVPTCAGGPDQTIPTSQLTSEDPTQADRIGRDGRPSTCAGKISPGGGFPGTHPYETFTFANTSGAARCYTVTINAELGGPGDIESVAYDQVYDPANIDANYLGDSGISGLGTTVSQASYSFTVPALHNFVVVVVASGSTNSSPFSGTVSGFVDNTAGPGACSGGATPTATATATPTATPTVAPTVTPTATPTVAPTATPPPATPTPTQPLVTPTPTATPPAPTPTPPTPTPTPATPTPTATPTATPDCVRFTITINGAQEVPPNASAGTGTGTIDVDTVANTLSYNITFSGLGSAETMSHIHGFAPPGMNAGIIHDLPLGSPKIGVFNYSQAQEADILNGLSYVNIHSVNLPNGEIRGQIAGPMGQCPTPTPTATPTSTPTPATPTPTPTPTATPSTPTPTPTVTPATPTPTVTPATPTPTPATPTPTPATPTPTATPSTPTPTPSATTTPTATPTPTSPPAAQTINLSTRMFVQTGDNVGIGGFIITGSVPKTVLLRAIGPSLSGSVPNALTDPLLELHGPPGFVTIINNNWRETQEAEIQATGIPPTNDLESAILASLTPGNYTGIVRGNGNATGVGLIEVYDLDTAAASKLANISTRAFVQTGDDIVIAGFILGNNSGNDRIAVRGIGPSLTGFGVPNALANPTLELRDSNGTLLLANNDWQDNPAHAAELIAAGLAPTNDLESGIATTQPPGLYTALLAGQNNGTGNGLVEVYDRGATP